MNEIIRKMVKENARRRMRVSRVYAEPRLEGDEDEERAANDFAYWAATAASRTSMAATTYRSA